MSWRLFTHAVGMILRNFAAVLRLSLIPVLVPQGLMLAVWGAQSEPMGAGLSLEVTSPWMLPLVLLSVVGGVWYVVAWHRFVLLEERPEGALPPFHGGRMLAYAGRAVQFLLSYLVLVGLPVLLLVLIVTTLHRTFGEIGETVALVPAGLGGIALLLWGMVLFYRLGTMLPAAAIGAGFGPIEALRRTRGATLALIGLGILAALGALVGQGVLAVVAGAGPPLWAGGIGIVANWLSLVFGASFLTTVHGRYIEGRDLV